MLKKVLVLVVLTVQVLQICWGLALPTSAAGRSLYDQRQEGDLNVRVDLDNFVLLVARPVSSLDLFGAMAGLAAATDAKHQSSDIQAAAHHANEQQQHHDQELDKEEPRLEQQQQQQLGAVVVAAKKEPTTAAGKGLEEVVRTLRNMKEKELRDRKESEERSSSSGLDAKYKLLETVAEPQNLKLVGDAVENCGPGRHRDSKGICHGEKSKADE